MSLIIAEFVRHTLSYPGRKRPKATRIRRRRIWHNAVSGAMTWCEHIYIRIDLRCTRSCRIWYAMPSHTPELKRDSELSCMLADSDAIPPHKHSRKCATPMAFVTSETRTVANGHEASEFSAAQVEAPCKRGRTLKIESLYTAQAKVQKNCTLLSLHLTGSRAFERIARYGMVRYMLTENDAAAALRR